MLFGIGAGEQLLRRVPGYHADAIQLQIAQPGHEAEVVAGDDHVDIVQVGLGEQKVLLAVRRGRQRQHHVHFSLLQLGLHCGEVRHLMHVEAHAEPPFEQFHVVGDDAGETLPAVLELVGCVVGLRAHPDDLVRGQPRLLRGGELVARPAIGLTCGGVVPGSLLALPEVGQRQGRQGDHAESRETGSRTVPRGQ